VTSCILQHYIDPRFPGLAAVPRWQRRSSKGY
jgi:hypothetical protein